MAATEQPLDTESVSGQAQNSFWAIVRRYDKTKISFPVSLRNAAGVTLPLVAGLMVGNVAAGIAMATGALNVSYSDGTDVYRVRARRLLLASVCVGLAVFAGALSGRSALLAAAVAGLGAFAAGLLVALGQTAADIGTVSLVTLVIYNYNARQLSVRDAALAGLLALLGGLLQSGLALSTWPVRRFQPLRRSIGELYLALAVAVQAEVNVHASPPATAQSTAARDAMARYGVDHSEEAERYRSLLNQGERIRLSLLVLARLRRRLERECENGVTAAAPPLEALKKFLAKTAEVLASVGESMTGAGGTGRAAITPSSLPTKLNVLPPGTEAGLSAFGRALLDDIRFQTEALGGQLRAALELAQGGGGSDAAPSLESQPVSGLRFRERLLSASTTLRASLTLESAAGRHALRLGVTVALAECAGRAFGFHRYYWLPMTVAIILKPDFSTTFSRGILRLGGTLTGLAVATLLNMLLSVWIAPSPWLDVVFVALFTFVLRSFGAANYGVFTTAISALIVYLFALAGVAPRDVVEARAVDSVVGGVLALVAYWIWPTWEGNGLGNSFSAMLESYRDYFGWIAKGYLSDGLTTEGIQREIDKQRLAARLGRTNLEASVMRYSAEPRVSADQIRALSAMMASSHRLVHAMMSLETGLGRTVNVKARPAFAKFAERVTVTLTLLARQWRGTPVPLREFPGLRPAQGELASQGTETVDRYALVNIETDRITNSLNTLAEQVREWLQ